MGLLGRKVRNFLGLSLYEKFNVISSMYWKAKTFLFYKAIFGSMGRRCLIRRPMFLSNPQFIHLGDFVNIRDGVRMEAVIHAPHRLPRLMIGNNVNIEQNVHIICQSNVQIGDNVSITAQCAIVDTTHPFDDVPADAKVGSLIKDEESFVEIGDGTFLGIGCIVLPNVRIGKGCVIGAHSVVTCDIPDYSVAVGSPAVFVRNIRRLPQNY